jgi:phage repressor protein C with HTH and peptisase S24 domain
MELRDIPGRLKAMNRSQADLARHLNLDPSSLTKTLKGERNVQAAEVSRIEDFFGDRLLLPDAPARLIGPRRSYAPRKIPVYGYAAAGSEDRVAFADNRVLEWREPPPFWSGAGELVYVRLIGDSMEPRYFDGEVVPVRFGVTPAKNEDCLIEFNDNTVLIKTFGGRVGTTILARQYHPRQELKLEATRIRSLHAVWRPSLI